MCVSRSALLCIWPSSQGHVAGDGRRGGFVWTQGDGWVQKNKDSWPLPPSTLQPKQEEDSPSAPCAQASSTCFCTIILGPSCTWHTVSFLELGTWVLTKSQECFLTLQRQFDFWPHQSGQLTNPIRISFPGICKWTRNSGWVQTSGVGYSTESPDESCSVGSSPFLVSAAGPSYWFYATLLHSHNTSFSLIT